VSAELVALIAQCEECDRVWLPHERDRWRCTSMTRTTSSSTVPPAQFASSMTTTRESQRLATSNARSSRAWAWAALAGAVVLYVGGVPSFGLTVFLSPLTVLLSWAAWRRSPHDGLFWTGLVLNGLLALGLLVVLIGLLTGGTGIGWD
jgi:hypothetical protein